MFSYLYLHNVILQTFTATSLITNYVSALSTDDQMRLFGELQQILSKKGYINQTVAN